MEKSFLEQVHLGQTEWYRYFFGIILILFFWLVLGSLFVVVPLLWVMLDGDPATAVDLQTGMITGVNPLINYVALNLSFGMMIVGVFVTVRFVHGRPFRSIITPAKTFEWRRMWQGFGLWLLLVAVASLVEYLLHPEIYTVVFNARRFLPFALVVLLLTPMQTTAEELLFRGYLLQATGHMGRNFRGAVAGQRHLVYGAAPGQPRAGRQRHFAAAVLPELWRCVLLHYPARQFGGAGDWRTRGQQPLLGAVCQLHRLGAANRVDFPGDRAGCGIRPGLVFGDGRHFLPCFVLAAKGNGRTHREPSR
jgi:membrane protease YdiL (CAAX protease family)